MAETHQLRYKKCSDFNKGRIVQYHLHFPDISIRAIGRKFDFNEDRISSIIKDFNNDGTCFNAEKKKPGPKNKISDRIGR